MLVLLWISWLPWSTATRCTQLTLSHSVVRADDGVRVQLGEQLRVIVGQACIATANQDEDGINVGASVALLSRHMLALLSDDSEKVNRTPSAAFSLPMPFPSTATVLPQTVAVHSGSVVRV
jgi:hypothetical protein